MVAVAAKVSQLLALSALRGTTAPRVSGLRALAAIATDSVPRISQLAVLAVSPPREAMRGNVSQLVALVPYADSNTPPFIPRVSQLLSLVVWGSGFVSEQRSRAWGFVLDGHPMYALDLGDEGTYIFDLSTKQWCKFQTQGHVGWNMRNGTMWGTDLRIIGADVVSPYAWEFDPSTSIDEGFRPITHIVTGFIALRSRVYVGMSALRVAMTAGNIQDNANPVVLRLRYSDDSGQTWSTYRTVLLSPTNTKQDIAFRSLGSFMAPGRVIELSDDGGPWSIMGADAFLNNFDEEGPSNDGSGAS